MKRSINIRGWYDISTKAAYFGFDSAGLEHAGIADCLHLRMHEIVLYQKPPL